MSEKTEKAIENQSGSQPPEVAEHSAWHLSRRQAMGLGVAGVAGALLVRRACFYDLELPDEWAPAVLADWEVAVLVAAAGALVPDVPAELSMRGASADGLFVARRVDGFLQGLPDAMLMEIHAMFGLIEHGTILGGYVARFTRLSPAERLDFLQKLKNLGSKFAQAAVGMRDLCLLGWYANPRTWAALGYDGPLLERPAPRPVAARGHCGPYDRLLAAPGQAPRGA